MVLEAVWRKVCRDGTAEVSAGSFKLICEAAPCHGNHRVATEAVMVCDVAVWRLGQSRLRM